MITLPKINLKLRRDVCLDLQIAVDLAAEHNLEHSPHRQFFALDLADANEIAFLLIAFQLKFIARFHRDKGLLEWVTVGRLGCDEETFCLVVYFHIDFHGQGHALAPFDADLFLAAQPKSQIG